MVAAAAEHGSKRFDGRFAFVHQFMVQIDALYVAQLIN